MKKRIDDLETLVTSITEPRGAAQASVTDGSLSEAFTPCTGLSDNTGSENQISSHHAGHVSSDRSDESAFDLTDFITPSSILPDPSPSDLTLWDPASSIDACQLVHDKDSVLGSQPWISYTECGCLQPHVQVSSLGPRVYKDLHAEKDGPRPCSADPYANTLCVERMCIIRAVWANCLHIGITEDMFCDDDAVSPFFRPSTRKSVDASRSDSMVKSIQNIFKTLKVDVRPIREQITNQHHPMIDVLPFPTLRKNLITNGGTVDEDELFDDLFNGLICWGGAGVGQKDRDCSTGKVSTGTPWDNRSWEGRTWFLQKYWTLLGGEDGELVQQSEWWRSMRGDETDIWTGL